MFQGEDEPLSGDAIALNVAIRAFLKELYPGKGYTIRITNYIYTPETLWLTIERHPEDDEKGVRHIECPEDR